MSFYWTVTPEQAWGDLVEEIAERIEAEILAYAEELTDEISQWMRDNARWQDRTGEARAGLYSYVVHLLRDSIVIVASHGPTITYDIYLETVAGGFYGIIGDTIDHFAPRVFHKVREIVHKAVR